MNGSDMLHGAFEWTVIEVGGENDLFGVSDNDVLHGGEGSDRLAGEDGDDVLFGNGGNDFLYGAFADTDSEIGARHCF